MNCVYELPWHIRSGRPRYQLKPAAVGATPAGCATRKEIYSDVHPLTSACACQRLPPHGWGQVERTDVHPRQGGHARDRGSFALERAGEPQHPLRLQGLLRELQRMRQPGPGPAHTSLPWFPALDEPTFSYV